MYLFEVAEHGFSKNQKLADKNLGKLKNVYQRIMKTLSVEILIKQLLNVLYFYYLM